MVRKHLGSNMKRYAAFLTVLIVIMLQPSLTMAHASLVRAVPASNSLIAASPQQIELVFNERLEKNLYYIKVINDQGESATSNKAQMDARQTTVTLKLPKLVDGTYITTYHIVSADGHPIAGSYLFTVGKTLEDNTFIAPASSSLQSQPFSWNMPMQKWLLFSSRFFYYMSLLALVGWVIWAALLGEKYKTKQQIFIKWRVGLLRFFMIALIFLVYYHYQELIGDAGAQELLHLFLGTSIGISWLASFILALLGFIMLQRKLWMDVLWSAALIAAKVLNGHAMGFKPLGWTMILDWIHLLAATIWVGGLMVGIVFWRNKAFLLEWLPQFSKTALGSIVILTITGSLTTIIFLPKISYVQYTQWGTFLLLKVGLVVFIAFTGFWIRRHLRKDRIARDIDKSSLSIWFKLDLLLMVLVLVIVGLLTYAAPLPPNQALDWHVMGEKAHFTVNITPNIPGSNEFNVEVWLPNQAGKPKKVELLLQDEDDLSIAPISVPLQALQDPAQDSSAGVNESFIGFKKYSFKSEGSYLSFAGKWGLELKILNAKNEELSYTNEMRIY
jgi:copper transport protein